MKNPAIMFIESVASDLGREVSLSPPQTELSDFVPEPLRALYSLADGGDVLIGHVFSQTQMAEARTQLPLPPHWIPFGTDQCGGFWLCAVSPTNSLWITSWDHDLDDEIDGPVFSDLAEFFRERYQSALECREGDGNFLVISEVPPGARTQVVLEVKKLAGLTSSEALTRVSTLPLKLPAPTALAARETMVRLRALEVDCHLKLDFF